MRNNGQIVLMVVLVAGMVLTGCQRASRGDSVDQAPDLVMKLAPDPDPPAVGTGRLVITLTDQDGRPVEGASLRIKGDMSHAGMVPVRAQISGGNTGVYQTEFQWTMAGDWVVTVIAALPDGRMASRQFPFSVP